MTKQNEKIDSYNFRKIKNSFRPNFQKKNIINTEKEESI